MSAAYMYIQQLEQVRFRVDVFMEANKMNLLGSSLISVNLLMIHVVCDILIKNISK